MKRYIALIVVLIQLAPTVLPAKEVTGAEIVNCGEIEANPTVARQAEPKTALGYVHVMDELEMPTFKPGCPHIRAALGTRFGMQVQITGSPDYSVVDELVTRVTHPPMLNPETGKSTTQDEWKSPMNIGYGRFTGWRFEKDWELVAGPWTIEILYKGKALARKEFTVVVEK